MSALDLKKKRAIYLQAKKNNYAIASFNFSEISQIKGILAAAKKTGLPVMIETSEGESKYLGLETAVMLKNMAEKELGRPIILNLDHGKSFEYLCGPCGAVCCLMLPGPQCPGLIGIRYLRRLG